MPRPRARRYTARATRRRTAWFGAIFDPATIGATGQALLQLSAALPDVVANPIGRQGLTLIRTVGTLRANSTDAVLSAEGAFGFIMMDGDAFAAGSAPDPIDDPDAPWLHWDRRAFLPASDAHQHIHLDIKAKRRWRGNDMEFAFVFDNDDAAQSIEFTLGIRMLLALP